MKMTGFGTMMQSFSADRYRGAKIHFSADVKADHVKGWAGLWMRIDAGRTSVAFDNMQQRPIKGTRDWKRYSIVLDVPRESTGISLGILLDGQGAVWMSGASFGVSGSESMLTGIQSTAGVTTTDQQLFHITLPANKRWGAVIPNPDNRPVTIFNIAGKVCWDPNPGVKDGCNGPDGSGRIPRTEMSQPDDFLAPDKPAGAVVAKWEAGKTYFSINDRSAAFEDKSGQFEFDARLDPK
jgi:hypothetical protein